MNPDAFKGPLAYQSKFLHLDACQDVDNDLELRAGLETKVFLFQVLAPGLPLHADAVAHVYSANLVSSQ